MTIVWKGLINKDGLTVQEILNADKEIWWQLEGLLEEAIDDALRELKPPYHLTGAQIIERLKGKSKRLRVVENTIILSEMRRITIEEVPQPLWSVIATNLLQKCTLAVIAPNEGTAIKRVEAYLQTDLWKDIAKIGYNRYFKTSDVIDPETAPVLDDFVYKVFQFAELFIQPVDCEYDEAFIRKALKTSLDTPLLVYVEKKRNHV